MKKLLISLIFLCSVFFLYSSNDTIGVYYVDANDKLIKIEPIKFYKSKTNTLGAALSMGVASSSIKTIFKGNESSNKVNKESIFYFYFSSPSSTNMNSIQDNWMFIQSSSPKDFVIVKFNQKKKERELTIGKVNIYSGTDIGISEDENVIVKTEKIKDNIYKVSINADKGEYCFVYNNAGAGSGAFLPVFDFSVVKN